MTHEHIGPGRREGTPAVRAVGLRRRFARSDGVDVLRGVELHADPGEIVAITGRSGSGKTTLLALLSGFDTPDEGTVTFTGEPAADVPWSVCAVLPQALGLAAELTCAENVALPLLLRRTPPDEVETTVTDLLDELGLADLADRYPAELSFGQQQRVALARAVGVRPSVLLVDEPTAHLDPDSAQVVLALLRRVADEGAAIVVVTHDPVVLEVADRRLRLEDGVLVPA